MNIDILSLMFEKWLKIFYFILKIKACVFK